MFLTLLHGITVILNESLGDNSFCSWACHSPSAVIHLFSLPSPVVAQDIVTPRTEVISMFL